MARRRHRNPYVEKRIRELALGGWLSTPKLIAALAEAVNDALVHAEQQEADDDLTPARRAYRALVYGKRLSAAELERAAELSPAELAFRALLDDRHAYAVWAHETREAHAAGKKQGV